MTEVYDGDGYEFSFRLPNYQKLSIHVTKAVLEALNAAPDSFNQLSVLAREMPLLHQLASRLHDRTGKNRIVIRLADLEEFRQLQIMSKTQH
jgi:hypothetical protein